MAGGEGITRVCYFPTEALSTHVLTFTPNQNIAEDSNLSRKPIKSLDVRAGNKYYPLIYDACSVVKFPVPNMWLKINPYVACHMHHRKSTVPSHVATFALCQVKSDSYIENCKPNKRSVLVS